MAEHRARHYHIYKYLLSQGEFDVNTSTIADLYKVVEFASNDKSVITKWTAKAPQPDLATIISMFADNAEEAAFAKSQRTKEAIVFKQDLEETDYKFNLVGPWTGTIGYTFQFRMIGTLVVLQLVEFSVTTAEDNTPAKISISAGDALVLLAPAEVKYYPFAYSVDGAMKTGYLVVKTDGMVELWSGTSDNKFGTLLTSETIVIYSTTIVYTK